MAVITAAQTGNWSNTATWTGGVKPGVGDTAQTGNFFVTIDEDITVATLEPTGTGRFDVVAGGRTINANVIMNGTSSLGGFRVLNNDGGVVILNGNVSGGASQRCAVRTSGNGTLIINGNVTGGAGTNCYGAHIEGTAGTLIINGNATGGSGAAAYGAFSNSGPTTLIVNGFAIGNEGGPGGSTTNLTPGVYGNGANGQIVCVRSVQAGPYGSVGIGGAVLLEDHTGNQAQFRTAYNGATKTLVDSGAAADFPATANVRAGTTYNVGNLTGTLAVPAANQVAAGVAVDATVGTATLTAANVRDAIGMAAANLDTQLDNIPTNAELTAALAGADDAVLNAIAALNNLSSAGAQAAAAAALAAYNAATEGDVTGLSIPTTGQIADAVWDEPIADHLAAGSAGEALDGAGGSSAADIWSYGARTLTAATVAGPGAALDGAAITLWRGDSFSVTLTGLGNIANRTKLWLTAKARSHQDDSAALFQVVETTGLTYIAGAAAGTAANGALTVTDAAAGDMTLTLDEVEAAKLPPLSGAVWDIQVRRSTGAVTTLAVGTLTVMADVTRATS